MGRARWVATIGSLALVLAGAVGCGPTSAASVAANCTAPGVDSNSIKVGLVMPYTGPSVDSYALVRAGINARIGLANENGGIAGRKIEVVPGDDHSTTAGNLVASRSLVENQGVFGLLEAASTVSGSAAYLDARGVPVAGIVAEAGWSQHRNMFAYSYRYTHGPSADTIGQYVERSGGTKALMLEDGLSSTSVTSAQDLATSVTSKGVLIVDTADYTDGLTDPRVIVDHLRRSGADVIVSAVPGHALATVLAAARQADLPIKAAIGGDGYDTQLLNRFGADIAGMAVFIDFVPFQPATAALNTFHRAMTRYSPEVVDAFQVPALQGYITADLFLRGLTIAGLCPSRAGFVNGLRAVTDYDAGGLLPGPINMKTNYTQINACYYIVRVDETGRDFDVVPGDSGPDRREWCGSRMVGR